MTINALTIKGYRSIQELQFPLSAINVITGPNGCGKSNLYKAIYLLSQTAYGQLAKTLAREGGMPSILWAGKKRQTTLTNKPVRLVLGVQSDTFNYELACGLPEPTLSLFALDPLVKEEYVWFGDTKKPSTTFLKRESGSAWIKNVENKSICYPLTISQSESILSQLKEPHLYPELSSINHEMKSWRFYHNFRTDVDSPIRMPQVGVHTPILSNDGADLAAALQTIIEIGNGNLLHEVLDKAFPNCKLVIASDDKTRFEVQLKMPGILRPLEARELSDGTLRYLCLAAALLSPRPASLLALNEPEMSLHPDLLKPLAELIILASMHSQMWVTTHSEQLASAIADKSNQKVVNLTLTENGTKVATMESWKKFL